MASIKLLLGTIAISSALGGLILLWTENATTQGKALATMFFILALISTKEVSKLNKE